MRRSSNNNNNNNNVYFLKQSFYKWKNERKNKKQSINWIPVLCPGGNTKYFNLLQYTYAFFT